MHNDIHSYRAIEDRLLTNAWRVEGLGIDYNLIMRFLCSSQNDYLCHDDCSHQVDVNEPEHSYRQFQDQVCQAFAEDIARTERGGLPCYALLVRRVLKPAPQHIVIDIDNDDEAPEKVKDKQAEPAKPGMTLLFKKIVRVRGIDDCYPLLFNGMLYLSVRVSSVDLEAVALDSGRSVNRSSRGNKSIFLSIANLNGNDNCRALVHDAIFFSPLHPTLR